MRDLRRLSAEDINKVELMAHNHPAYETILALYDSTLLGKVTLLGYTPQNFFLDVIDRVEFFIIESQGKKPLGDKYFEESWEVTFDELSEFADDAINDSEDKATEELLHNQIIKVDAAIHAAESLIAGLADEEIHSRGNEALMSCLCRQYPEAAQLKEQMKTAITPQQQAQLQKYVEDMIADEGTIFLADDYYDELRPDTPVTFHDASASWWHIAEDKKDIFARHLAQMLDEGVFTRQFQLPIDSREALISDVATFFNLEDDEFQNLMEDA